MTTRTFDVTYVVTRTEAYRIEAASPTEADELAFAEGVCLDCGETSQVEPIDWEIVAPDNAPEGST